MTPWRGFRRCDKCGKRRPYPDEFSPSRRNPKLTSRICRDCRGKKVARKPKQPRYRRCQVCGRRRDVPSQIRPQGRQCLSCFRAKKRAYSRAYYAKYRDWKIKQAAKQRKANPEAQARYQHNAWLKLRSDPERYAKYLQDKRIWTHVHAERNGHKIEAHKPWAIGKYEPPPNGNHSSPLLDAGPLVEWLRHEFGSWSTRDMARRFSVDESGLARLLDGRYRQISLVTADRICVHADCTHMLALLYPDSSP